MTVHPIRALPSACVPTAPADFPDILFFHATLAGRTLAFAFVATSHIPDNAPAPDIRLHTLVLSPVGSDAALRLTRQAYRDITTPNDLTGALRTIADDIRLTLRHLDARPPETVPHLHRDALMDWLHAESYVDFPSQALALADSLIHTWTTIDAMLQHALPFDTGAVSRMNEMRTVASDIRALPWRAPCEMKHMSHCHV